MPATGRVIFWLLCGSLTLAMEIRAAESENQSTAAADKQAAGGRRWHADLHQAKQAALVSGRPIMVVFR